MRDTPTTGDYDLAFTAPSRDHERTESFIEENTVVKQFESKHGPYTCTTATQNLLGALNDWLGSDLVVHGDEMNNDKFTQELDDSYVIFQPDGKSFLLEAEDLGKYLGSINDEYHTQLNNNWGTLEAPSISGQALYNDGRSVRLSRTKSSELHALRDSQIKAAKEIKDLKRKSIERSFSGSQGKVDRRTVGMEFLRKTHAESKYFRGRIYTDKSMQTFWEDQSRKVDVRIEYDLHSSSSESSGSTD